MVELHYGLYKLWLRIQYSQEILKKARLVNQNLLSSLVHSCDSEMSTAALKLDKIVLACLIHFLEKNCSLRVSLFSLVNRKQKFDLLS